MLGFALLLLLGYAFTWIGALIGLSVRTPEAATSGGLVWLFPVTFLSNAFVDSSKLPGWLQPVAEWNPVQRHRPGLPETLRRPRPFPLRRLADAVPGVGLADLLGPRRLPHPLRPQVPPRRGLTRPREGPPPERRGAFSWRCGAAQRAEPAFQADQFMFQPLRPLSGAIVLSLEFLTITTSPIIDWS